MGEPEVDARAALKALFEASRPRTPQGSSILSKDPDGESAAQRAGVALRQLFKGDMHRALHPPAAAGRLKEIEAHVGKLLEQVSPSAKFKPPPRGRPVKSKNCVDVEVQTTVNMAKIELVDPVMPEPKPDMDLDRLRPRLCVIPDKSPPAVEAKGKMREYQKKLLDVDTQTTALTRQLKLLRIAHWEKQRDKCAKEQKVMSILAAHADKLPQNGQSRHEQEELDKEFTRKQTELCAAKQQAKHWSRQARRYDKELQEQFRGGGDVQRILLKHPAGEVFLPPMGADSDDGSDDDYYRAAPRRGEVQLASSDEEEDGKNERAPPPPPSQQWRSVAGQGDDNASDGSSMTSPSGESGGMRSPMGERTLRPAGASRARSNSDSSSNSDDNKAKGGESKVTRVVASGSAAPQGSPVPPLPELSGLSSGAAATATPPKVTASSAADLVAEEVSSEEIWSQDGGEESSRSC